MGPGELSSGPGGPGDVRWKLLGRGHPGALHYATVMDTDGRGDQIAPERRQPCQRTFLVAAGEAAEADHVSGKNSGKPALSVMEG